MIIKNATRVLKTIAKELKIPVIALAQADRNLDNENSEPKMKDLYGGSYIEKTADLVIFLQGKVYDMAAAERDNEFDLVNVIAKHKNGPVGQYVERWKKNFAQIKNL
jgi:replicative DNA helicase